MKRIMFTALAFGLGLTANLWGQVPSYVPTNGLVGWWPFNGNANDESGNGNNGTVNGATLTMDRFGVANKAYSFDGGNDFISVSHNQALNLPGNNNSFSFSLWIKPNQTNQQELNILSKGSGTGMNSNDVYILSVYNQDKIGLELANFPNASWTYSNDPIIFDEWNNIVVVYENNLNVAQFYFNGLYVSQQQYPFIPSSNSDNQSLFFGKQGYNCNCNFMNGLLDDIGIWNRALTQQEISNLYNSSNCSNDLTISPILNTQNIGGNATFTATTSESNPTYSWQSDLGQGFQTLNNYGNYSGANTNTLTISNVQLANHNQQIRAISTSGNCVTTSNIATIQIADTCITNVTVYDTILTTVTDTLIINTTLSLPAPNNENTILIYPNPASDHITIDNGNFAAMAGYSIKIENNAGQQVFQSAINQAQFYVDLSTWTGNGLYFVHLIDPQNNTVTVRKIVLQ